MTWWKKLLGRSETSLARAARPINPDLVFSTRLETQDRVEHALPGTADIPVVIELVQPPADPWNGPPNTPCGAAF
jgi:hypothetical protein